MLINYTPCLIAHKINFFYHQTKIDLGIKSEEPFDRQIEFMTVLHLFSEVTIPREAPAMGSFLHIFLLHLRILSEQFFLQYISWRLLLCSLN